MISFVCFLVFVFNSVTYPEGVGGGRGAGPFQTLNCVKLAVA